MGNLNKKRQKFYPNECLGRNVTHSNEPEHINITPISKYKAKSLSLEIKQYNPFSNEIFEDIITYPDLPNSIIIALRSGKINEISDFIPPVKESLKTETLYSFSKGLYSLILLTKNNNKICAGLENEIFILNLKIDGKHILENEKQLLCQEEGKISCLLELENGNIISAGKNIILWKINELKEYTKVSSIPIQNYKMRIMNLVEFPFFKTLIATQEETHNIYILKNEENSISLLQTKEDIPSIWYKGSAQRLTKNGMILVGKFEINVIDPSNGEKVSRYPGIDRGTLLNFSQKYKNKDFWIVTEYNGRYLELYEQEENDLIYSDKYEFEDSENIGWFNRLVKINEECFISINHYAKISVFKINFLKQ